MSKIHVKTGSICPICVDTIEDEGVVMHTTRRQTHRLCVDCGIGYLQPFIKKSFDNLRQNIRQNVANIRCPGTYHGTLRNQCTHDVDIRKVVLPSGSQSCTDIIKIQYILSNPHAFLCPNNECDNIVETHPLDPITHTECLKCHRDWCRNCHASPYHEGISCMEYEAEEGKTENGRFIREKVKNGDMKYCPRCRTPTEKTKNLTGQYVACNKMTCTNCNVRWCWWCQEMNIDYTHFKSDSNSKCADLLWKGTE